MNIKTLVKISHQQAVDSGFWGEICKCKKPKPFELGRICVTCGKAIYGTKRNLSELLMLIVTELAEGCEALRKGHRQDKAIYDYYKGEIVRNEKFAKSRWVKDSFEDELADAVIRIADLCGAENIDLDWQIKKKLEYNKIRPMKHNKKF